eukprot:CAMPEP_0172644340 /NCGR_PEP_ID=MMETSP1068-20121228/239159_1 /TAXON_ID=35684 /ORGANISM="Pseudopedinella elastica, Strain CCMP716" /LENGTH=693 /DNA_ID=CAMNT_0013458533 /DNA_START=49 /DNA_END=2130 /DNA_ORIENTATION=-
MGNVSSETSSASAVEFTDPLQMHIADAIKGNRLDVVTQHMVEQCAKNFSSCKNQDEQYACFVREVGEDGATKLFNHFSEQDSTNYDLLSVAVMVVVMKLEKVLVIVAPEMLESDGGNFVEKQSQRLYQAMKHHEDSQAWIGAAQEQLHAHMKSLQGKLGDLIIRTDSAAQMCADSRRQSEAGLVALKSEIDELRKLCKEIKDDQESIERLNRLEKEMDAKIKEQEEMDAEIKEESDRVARVRALEKRAEEEEKFAVSIASTAQQAKAAAQQAKAAAQQAKAAASSAEASASMSIGQANTATTAASVAKEAEEGAKQARMLVEAGVRKGREAALLAEVQASVSIGQANKATTAASVAKEAEEGAKQAAVESKDALAKVKESMHATEAKEEAGRWDEIAWQVGREAASLDLELVSLRADEERMKLQLKQLEQQLKQLEKQLKESGERRSSKKRASLELTKTAKQLKCAVKLLLEAANGCRLDPEQARLLDTARDLVARFSESPGSASGGESPGENTWMKIRSAQTPGAAANDESSNLGNLARAVNVDISSSPPFSGATIDQFVDGHSGSRGGTTQDSLGTPRHHSTGRPATPVIPDSASSSEASSVATSPSSAGPYISPAQSYKLQAHPEDGSASPFSSGGGGSSLSASASTAGVTFTAALEGEANPPADQDGVWASPAPKHNLAPPPTPVSPEE